MIRRVGQVALALLSVGLLILIVWTDLHYHWSGYSWFTVPLTAEQIVERQKTIWDWLDLLIVPAVIALSAIVFGWMERKNERKIASDRAEQDRRLADERVQEAALESYLEKMSVLLLDKGLLASSPNSQIRDLARAWTRAALRRLTQERKGILLSFLNESQLIKGKENIVVLDNVDLSKATLRWADLSHTNLSGVDFTQADLSGADFTSANLAGAICILADLREANFAHANLAGANLRGADISRANFTNANLVNMLFDGGVESQRATGTLWPEGFVLVPSETPRERVYVVTPSLLERLKRWLMKLLPS